LTRLVEGEGEDGGVVGEGEGLVPDFFEGTGVVLGAGVPLALRDGSGRSVDAICDLVP
jgi:hypothetical protein